MSELNTPPPSCLYYGTALEEQCRDMGFKLKGTKGKPIRGTRKYPKYKRGEVYEEPCYLKLLVLRSE